MNLLNRIRSLERESFRTLDVGCGLNFKGDVNLDLILETTVDRSRIKEGEQPFKISANAIPNFVIGDIHRIPFRDGVFHTVFCHHVLEHKGINPTIAIKELLRVAKYKVEICVPHFLMQNAKNPKVHARVYRGRHLNRIFKNYYHTIKQTWELDRLWKFHFPRPRENIVTVYKGLK